MMVTKLKRLVGNPRRKPSVKRRIKRKPKANHRKRSKMNAKRPKKRRVAKAAPKKNKRRRKAGTRSNPAHLLHLGLVNPKRRKSVAKTRKRKKTSNRRRRATSNKRRVTRRASNPVRRVVYMKAKNKKKRNTRRRRNPVNLFGSSMSTVQVAKILGSGLIGVAATKAVLPMLPDAFKSSVITRLVSGVVVAGALGWVGSKFISPDVGSGLLFGGLMQAVSEGLNSVIPPLPVLGRIGLSGRGVGDFVPARFTIPEVPVLLSGPSASRGGPIASRAYRAAY